MSDDDGDDLRLWKLDPAQIRQLFSKIDILKSVPDAALDELAEIAIPRGLAKRDVLWREDDPHLIAIVCMGNLEVRNGKELIDIMLPYQLLGHSALLARRHTATVIAGIDARVLCVDASHMARLCRQHFALMEAVLADALALVSKLNAHLKSSKWRLNDRLCYWLSWLSRGKKGARVNVTQKQLAKLTGSSHYTISKELEKIAKTGAIRQSHGYVIVFDMDLARRGNKT